jgi:hypothetical protein
MHLWTLTTCQYSIVRLKVLALRSSLFWDVTQGRLLIIYTGFGTTYRPYLQGSNTPKRNSVLDWLPLEDGTGRFSRNVGNLTDNLRCVTSQKSECLNYTPAGDWNYAHCWHFTPNKRSEWLEDPTNHELYVMHRKPNIVTTIHVRGLEWSGRLVRVSDGTVVKKLFLGKKKSRKTRVKVVSLFWEWYEIDWYQEMAEESRRHTFRLSFWRSYWLNCKDRVPKKMLPFNPSTIKVTILLFIWPIHYLERSGNRRVC